MRYLYSLQKFGIKFGLSKTSNLLAAFGNPHKGQKYIHIAGTNGKGSVAALLASIYKAAGFKVGFYSSPHLVRFTERFTINDREMPAERAVNLIARLRKAVVPQEPPTYFEATTAMALLYFAEENTDLAIMEVGMGGRLDATNVITPLVSVITNISLEHREFLGRHLQDIANEKAGIIKDGIDVVAGVRQPAVIDLIRARCNAKKAPFWRLGKDFRCRASGSEINYYGIGQNYRQLRLGLQGKFQRRNGALALAVGERLGDKGLPVSEEHIREGLQSVLWPGRMHVVGKDPTIILDGGHNPGAIKALAEAVGSEFEYRRLILVIGIMQDKQLGPMLKAIVAQADYVIYTRPEYYRAAAPEVLQAAAAPMGRPGEVVRRLSEALQRARQLAAGEDLILVCGSLFTVGEALSYFDPRKYRPDEL